MIGVVVEVGAFREVEEGTFERAVAWVMGAEGAGRGTVNLTLLGDAEIRDLNREWLSRDRPTDVLAFALHGPGEPILGDIYIGYEQARRQAREWSVPIEEELVRLAVHGTLHVLGHEHPEEGREESPFFLTQERYVEALCHPRSRDGV